MLLGEFDIKFIFEEFHLSFVKKLKKFFLAMVVVTSYSKLETGMWSVCAFIYEI